MGPTFKNKKSLFLLPLSSLLPLTQTQTAKPTVPLPLYPLPLPIFLNSNSKTKNPQIKIAKNAVSRFECYLSAGISCVIAIQTLLNIAVVTGTIPPTGLPLPFISSGGSSLMVFMASAGILIAIDKNSKKHQKISCAIL